MTVVCLDDAPDQLMADHVPGVEVGECYVVDAAQNALDGGQTGSRHGEVYLRDVSTIR